jgi:Zn-dependent protease
MNTVTFIFSITILIVSVIFHELAHGTMADRLGDPTPKLQGRLTLNPFAHLEWIGSFLVPLVCIISGSGFIIGWAKPVVFNVAHLKYKRWGPALVAAAGPFMNLTIALVCAIVFRIVVLSGFNPSFTTMLVQVIVINTTLFVFNLIPIPPLDGYHILGAVIPKFKWWADRLIGKYGLVLLILVLLITGSVIGPVVAFITKLLLL